MQKTDQTILLVEPDPDLRSSICELMEVFGYKPVVAANLEQALVMYEQFDDVIECLVVAAFMPRSTGLEVVDAISRFGRPLPTLLLSVFAADEEIQRRTSCGDAVFLAVPFSPDSFKSKLQEVLELRTNMAEEFERSALIRR